MILTSAIAPPIFNIPITEDGKSRPPSGDLSDPRIWDLRSIEEDLNSGTTREETADEVAISLSTDVLFEVGESRLTSTASQTLQQVAQEIESSSGSVVEIDGHTDDTGTDSINDPLSLDRAESVKRALSDLISKPTVEYKVEGHGSQQPIATNETDEGRKKNRRVTITFQR
ncbi:OmpA family protein [Streptomonospora sp. PA3]|nr:OmpA family protein [Streptomonospora sp. PA3]MUL42531.1 OmpA family protein [Streptomonospora sp. PA3]